MTKKILILAMMIIGTSLFAAPADNFKAAGIGLGGYVSFNYNTYNFLNDDDDMKSENSSFNLRPRAEFFMIDNLSISLTPSFGTYSWKSFDGDNEIDDSTNYYSLGLALSARYYVTTVGEIIPFIGVFTGFTNYYYLDDYTDGIENKNESSETGYYYGFDLGGLYFLNDNFAISASTSFTFSGNNIMTDGDGDDHEYSDNYDSSEWLDMNIDLYVGFTYFIPNNKKLIISEL